jgi:phosphopantothenoylcysteine decarboxylase/phosphopantothenate--cysteine ligase
MQEHYRFAGFMGRRVHLGVCGSIAAYKMLDFMRLLLGADCMVSATLTDAATRFVTPLSFEALGANPVYGSMFNAKASDPFGHLEPGEIADAMVIAPATASTMARLANGLADDMLSCQALAFDGPVIVAPAMNPRMWKAPATQRNWAAIKELGFIPVEPDSGLVACGETGTGRFAEYIELLPVVLKAISPQDMAGKKVMVTLGPTREPWDAVRFWSNPSSGTMGACMAVAAWLRGADVTVVSGPVSLDFHSGIKQARVQTAQQMFDAATDLWPDMDLACCTAAVADYRPVPHGADKFKKSGADSGLTVEFNNNPDILRTLGERKAEAQRLMGFAAETSSCREEAERKLAAKNLDLIACNRIDHEGSGFAVTTNEMFVLDAHGRREQWPNLKKTEVAWRLWDHLLLS